MSFGIGLYENNDYVFFLIGKDQERNLWRYIIFLEILVYDKYKFHSLPYNTAKNNNNPSSTNLHKPRYL